MGVRVLCIDLVRGSSGLLATASICLPNGVVIHGFRIWRGAGGINVGVPVLSWIHDGVRLQRPVVGLPEPLSHEILSEISQAWKLLTETEQTTSPPGDAPEAN